MTQDEFHINQLVAKEEAEKTMREFTKEDFRQFIEDKTEGWSLTRERELRDELNRIGSCETGIKQHTSSEARKEELRKEIKEREDFIEQEFIDNPDFVHEQWKNKVTGGNPVFYRPELFDDPGPHKIQREIYYRIAKAEAEERMSKFTKEDFEEWIEEKTMIWSERYKKEVSKDQHPHDAIGSPHHAYSWWKAEVTGINKIHFYRRLL